MATHPEQAPEGHPAMSTMIISTRGRSTRGRSPDIQCTMVLVTLPRSERRSGTRSGELCSSRGDVGNAGNVGGIACKQPPPGHLHGRAQAQISGKHALTIEEWRRNSGRPLGPRGKMGWLTADRCAQVLKCL
eukprot:264750-Chlamydomonas_euryale.AAC.5